MPKLTSLVIIVALAGCSRATGPSPLPGDITTASAPHPQAPSAYQILYRFGQPPDANSPTTDLILVPQSSSGILYGTSYGGGQGTGVCANGCGTVYTIDPRNPSNGDNVIYSFQGGSNGAIPEAGLNPNGNSYSDLFGTTFFGGNTNYHCYIGRGCGTVYEIGASGNLTTLYSFKGGKDGSNPSGGRHFIAGKSSAIGTFYGTTEFGGSKSFGTIYSITTSGAEQVLHSFGGSPADGAHPVGDIADSGCPSKCVFYGVTSEGGKNNVGTIFQMDPTGSEKTLYSFNASDGDEPLGVEYSRGVLYGAASRDGANNRGSIFAFYLTRPKRQQFQVIHSFTGSVKGNDGALPYSRPIIYNDTTYGKALYGTTQQGGAMGGGTVYRIQLPSNHECIIHSFPDPTVVGGDGLRPDAPLRQFQVLGTNSFYGTTVQGPQTDSYHKGYGTIFEVSPAAPCTKTSHRQARR